MKKKSNGVLILIACLFASVFAISCNDSKPNPKELELKQKELELKEREISLREQETNETRKNSTQADKQSATGGNKRELRYFYYANGGLRGFFNDGTIVGCARCEFCRSNILQMFNDTPIGTYEVQSDGSLLVNKSEREFPDYQSDKGWVLIDYKWNEKVPQY